MRTMKKILFLIIGSGFLTSQVYAQIMGGQRNNSQPAVKEASASQVNAGAMQHNVNLFNGVLNASQSLGSVSTLEGLSYDLTLSYSSKYAGGDNVPITSGIPYGEGWNLGIPSITIDNNSFHNYSEQEELLFDLQLTDGSFNRKNMTREQLMKEGEVFWFSPFINIPGVVSERFVFKYYDNAENRSVFIPHKFESYIEARFDGQYWEVTGHNGNVYRFDVVQVTTNNSSNQRIHIPDPTWSYDMELMYHLVVPKSQVVGWYCSEISNPTHTAGQKIYFEYEKFGDFNYFQEYYDNRTAAHIGDHFIGPYKICVPWTCKCLLTPSSLLNYTAYKDILLKKVLAASYSTVLEELELDYKTINIRSLGAQNVIQPDDHGVSRKDSLYNSKTVYSAGIGSNYVSSDKTESGLTGAPVSDSYNANFPGWKRYLHIKADGSFLYDDSENSFSNGSDPYKAASQNGSYYCRTASLNVMNNDLPFSYGFLESPRIQFDDFGNEIAAGDLYEVKALIRHDNVSTAPGAGFCNFDINVVSGMDVYQEQNINVYGVNRPTALTIDDNKSSRIFSTFNQPVKWNTRSSLNTTHPGYIITSNMFSLPNIPAEYNGVQIQVGPANSDHDFSRDPQTVSALLSSNSSLIPTASSAYYGYLNSWEGNDLHPTSPIPGNFGMGLPWQMMERFYSNYDDGDLVYTAPRNRHWWSGGMYDINWNNEPTLAGNDVYLAGFAFIRHSKNAYMLHAVTKYRTNGEISPVDAQGRIAVSRFQMDYEVKLDTLLNNVISNSLVPQVRYHGVHNTIVLKSIFTVPVINSLNDPLSGYHPDDLPRTTFRYSQIRHADYSDGRSNKFYYPLTELTNKLGGRTRVEYFEMQPGTKNTANIRVIKAPLDAMSSNCITETSLAVKKIREEKGNNEFAEWDYDYQDKVVHLKAPVNAHLKKHFHMSFPDSEVGYKKTIVLNPPPVAGGERNYMIHYHYDNSQPPLFGKLKSSEYYNSDDQLLKKTELLYDAKLAYKNGVFRNNYQQYNTTDDYGVVNYSGTFAGNVFNVQNYDVPVKIADESVRFFETVDAAFFEESYLNSYFVPLRKKFEYEYEHHDDNKIFDVFDTPLTEGVLDAVNNPITGSVSNPALFQRVAPCTASPTPSIELLTVTEYSYWDADHLGNTISQGFRNLIPEFTGSIFQLRFEPSWNIFSERVSSPFSTGMFKKKEYYYYFDLRNYDESFVNPKFPATYQAQMNNLRNLAYEVRETSSMNGVDSVSASTYTLYSTKWNTNLEDILPMETIPYYGPLLCPGSGSGSGSSGGGSGATSVGNVPPDCIRALSSNNPPPPGYQLQYYNTIPFYCPLGAVDVTSTTSQRLIVYNQEPGIPNVGHWVAGKLKYSSTVVQAGDKLKSAYISLSRKPATGILSFKEVMIGNTQAIIPEYPFDTLRIDSVIHRTEFGQVKLMMDEKGLKTRFNYTYPQFRHYLDYVNPCNSYLAVYWADIFGPKNMIKGYELPSQQVQTYEYYPDNSVMKIISMNNETALFTYDAFGRLAQKFINGKLYDQYRYNTFNDDDFSTFSQRATLNFVDHWKVQTADSILRTRTYIDPAGREYQELSQSINGLNDISDNMLFTGEIKYDLSDRIIRQYKPFHIQRQGLPVYFQPKMNSIDNTLPQLFIENKYDDKRSAPGPVRSSDYGISMLNGHVSVHSSRLITTTELLPELNLSASEQAMITGNSSTAVFRKDISRDEDGKRKIIYSNSFGMKVAEKYYSSPLEPIITLYIYDDYGNMATVINPVKQQIIYKYNQLGWRYFESHPDKGLTTVMFNRSGQPVMVQDANGKAGSENNGISYCRLFTYDEFGRIIMQSKGSLSGFNPVAYLDDPAYPSYEFSPEKTSSWLFSLFVQAPGGTLEKKYLDFVSDELIEKEYSYDQKATLSQRASASVIHSALHPLIGQHQKNLQGRLSWTVQHSNGQPQYMTFFGYDSVGNIYRQMHQFNADGITQTAPGMVLNMSYTEHDRLGNAGRVEIDTDLDDMAEATYISSFDSRGRLRECDLNGIISASYRYNESEKAIENVKYFINQNKSCSKLQADHITYAYDDRSRLKEINSRFYLEQFRYDHEQLTSYSPAHGVISGTNYNGNINAIRSVYKSLASGSATIQQPTDYGYRYDEMNRLVKADCNIYDNLGGSNVPESRYRYGDEHFKFDIVGKIETLNRWLFYSSINLAPENKMNAWNYNYGNLSNRLMNIDSSGIMLRSYSYDQNGNMLTDTKRGITLSQFSSANLPAMITGNSSTVNYAYGVDDKRIYRNDPVRNLSEFYLRDLTGTELAIFNYQSGAWTYFLNGLSRVGELGDEIRFFEYDHLGNTRVSYKPESNCATGMVEYSMRGVYDYYPSGKLLRSSVSGEPERFLTTGNERDQESGLDYRNARFSDPEIGMFRSVDPLADMREWVSSYNFVQNNPIFRVDPNGALDGDYYNRDGTYLGNDGIDDNKVYVANGKTVSTNKDGTSTTMFYNANELSTTHSSFRKQAATVYAESSIGYGIESKEEMFAIASVHQKNKIAFGVGAPLAKKFLNTSLDGQSGSMKTANAAIINALTGGQDLSNGAMQWDGAEQAMVSKDNMDKASNGKYMFKMNVMGWNITETNYKSWKSAVENNFGTGRFTVPQTKAALHNYGGMKNSGKIRLQSTAQYGLTIFWKEK